VPSSPAPSRSPLSMRAGTSARSNGLPEAVVFRACDRVALWRCKGRNQHHGIVASGEVFTDAPADYGSPAAWRSGLVVIRMLIAG
jgi:hypothetical protein